MDYEELKQQILNFFQASKTHRNRNNVLGSELHPGELEEFIGRPFEGRERQDAGRAFTELTALGMIVPTYRDAVSPESWFEFSDQSEKSMGKKKERTFCTAFDTYTVVRQLGEGGSGVVYEVVDESGIAFALKTLRPESMTSSKRKRFKNEVMFCSDDQGPHIVKVVATGRVPDVEPHCPFYVMSKYDCDLAQRIKDGLSPDDAMNALLQLIEGIEVAHLKGVYHRDLKPENVLYSKNDDSYVVADFGIAHFREEDLHTAVKTKDKERLANFAYAAPEQRKPGALVDHRADIFALGLILNELFTKEIPHGTGYRLPSSIDDRFSYLDAIVEKSIQNDPSKRYQSIAEIKRDISLGQGQVIEAQRISELQGRVIKAGDVDAPLVVEPVRIVDVDATEEKSLFKLSPGPDRLWCAQFEELKGVERTQALSPRHVRFSGADAIVDRGLRDETSVIKYMRLWVDAANVAYREQRTRAAEQARIETQKNLEKEIAREKSRASFRRKFHES